MQPPRMTYTQRERIRMIGRRIGVVGLVASVVFALGACSSGGDGDVDGDAATADNPVDLTMVVFTTDETQIGIYEAMADEFRQTHPELGKFTVQSVPFAEYNTQVTARLNGGDAPDLGWVVESAAPAYMGSGALYDISALKDDPTWEFSDIRPGLLSALQTDDGKLYGYPQSNTTHPIVYNVDAFTAAGLETPLDLYKKGEWNWANLRSSAKALVDAGVVTYGFDIPQFAFSNYALFTPVMKGFGATAWPDNGTSCGYASSESQDAVEFLHGMIFDDVSYPPPGSVSSFETGDTGMVLVAPSTLSQMTEAPFEFEVVPQPSREDGTLDPFLGQAISVVFAAGKNPDLATELLGYFTRPTADFASKQLSPRMSYSTPDLVAQLNPLLTPDAAERSLIQTLKNATQIDYPVSYPQLESATTPVLDGAWTANADIPSVLEAACSVAQPILDAQ